MKKKLLYALTSLIVAGAGLYPALGDARSLDQQFDCSSDAHKFVATLARKRDIKAESLHVEANSVNAFQPAPGRKLTAFGFPVYVVIGYEPDNALFKTGSGTPFAGSIYGVVVTGSAEAVEARVRQAGSGAAVREVIPMLLTAIVCTGQP